jgi:hypothetical protein
MHNWGMLLFSTGRLLVVWALLIGQARPVPDQTTPRELGKATIDTPHLAVTTSYTGDGKRVTLLLDVAPKPKMHVYAPEEKRYMAVALILDRDDRFRTGPPHFPKGERFYFAPTEETQIVYSKPFRISQPVTLSSAIGQRVDPEGVVRIKGTLRYQACDDRVCYIPKNIHVEWALVTR